MVSFRIADYSDRNRSVEFPVRSLSASAIRHQSRVIPGEKRVGRNQQSPG